MLDLLLVGLGGAVGAIFRYLLGLIPLKGSFPFMTFFINVFGSFLIGFFVQIIALKNFPEEWTLLFKTGFCGGFTTFSTFSLETYNFLKDQIYITAILYIALSIICSLFGIWFGIYTANLINNMN